MRDSMYRIKQEAMLSKWSELVLEQERSGQGVMSWCEEQGISRSTFSKWVSRVRASEYQSAALGDNTAQVVCEQSGSEFVRISLQQSSTKSTAAPIMRVTLGDASCEIYSGAEASLVGCVVSALAVSL